MQPLEHPGLPRAVHTLRVPALHDHGKGDLDGEGQLYRLRNRSVRKTAFRKLVACLQRSAKVSFLGCVTRL